MNIVLAGLVQRSDRARGGVIGKNLSLDVPIEEGTPGPAQWRTVCVGVYVYVSYA